MSGRAFALAAALRELLEKQPLVGGPDSPNDDCSVTKDSDASALSNVRDGRLLTLRRSTVEEIIGYLESLHRITASAES